MDTRIIFEKKLSTYSFYKNVTKRLFNIYKSNKEELPVFDFRETEFISPMVVPVILSFGDYLKRLYGKAIPILYEEGSDLQNFFVSSNFYGVSEKLGIFSWGDSVLSGCHGKALRNLHKVSFTYASYPDADKIKDLTRKRNYIFDCLLDRSKVVYRAILHDTNRLPENIIDSTLNAIAEIETNAIMYSKSHSFTYVASDKYGTNISIADSGIGFMRAFVKAEQRLEVLEKFDGFDQKKFKNYLIIMSALNYSFQKHQIDKRENLWTLKTNIIDNNGTFKIQYENTQVVFSNSRCANCKKNKSTDNLFECVHCLMEDYSMNAYSPIKIFRIGYQGVRIEATIKREG